MGRDTAGLGLEGGPLVDAEAMLLVDDRQSEVGEDHRTLEECVRADDDRRLTAGDALAGPAPAIRRERARQQRDREAELLDQAADRHLVLAGQQVRRCE
jgi:hypothetical protein